MKFDTILFDLDGTLTDPALGITSSVAYALDANNIPYESLEALNEFIGPPLREQFMKYCNVDEKTGEEYVIKYREFYATKGIYMNKVYDGIENMLESLKNAGKKLIVATSKPEKFAKMILEHFEIDKYFDFCAGANLDNTRTDKSEVINYALESAKVDRNASKIIMVGDRMHDVIGAKKIGLSCIGVTFGYGSRKELENAGAKYIVDTVEQLENLLMS